MRRHIEADISGENRKIVRIPAARETGGILTVHSRKFPPRLLTLITVASTRTLQVSGVEDRYQERLRNAMEYLTFRNVSQETKRRVLVSLRRMHSQRTLNVAESVGCAGSKTPGFPSFRP